MPVDSTPLPDLFSFTVPGWRGEIVAHLRPADLEAELDRLRDPAQAVETIHWGRNYLYRARLETPEGPLDVVVKQFRNKGWLHRQRRKLEGSKAEKSFRFARAFAAAGIPTAEAIAVIESTEEDGPSFFVSRHLEGTLEARYLLRARNTGSAAEDYPEIDVEHFLDVLGRILGSMHGAGLFHRDLSIGNVLLTDDPDLLYVIDLNRARQRRRIGLLERVRDLCRLAIFRREDQQRFLRAYWQGEPGFLRWTLYKLYHHGFLTKIESKKRWRGVTARLRDWVRPRRAHVHIPEAPKDASARDKIVWDHLSDQPHQHAGRFDKLRVRLADAPAHLRQTFAFLGATPRAWSAYRRRMDALYLEPVPWQGVGVALRPLPENPGILLDAIDELAVRHVLVRLHPWEDGDDSDELELVRELDARGLEIAYALPQNRDLVRDPARWERRVAELAERFAPYGRHFQVGQAVNRSKWGIWTVDEYLRLARSAAEILRRYPGVEILGPAVIDFEVHMTAGILNHPRCPDFDAVASLLYVDRRGAPENRQLIFDTVGKVALVQAIADTARHAAPRSWITEVNWPLWEGPHSPAGRTVSVDEPTQADFLARFYLQALGTGLAERVYWWQLSARGYGLAVWDAGTLRKRPSFYALRTLEQELDGAVFLGPLDSPEGAHLYRFRRGDGGETVAGWTVEGRQRVQLPQPAVEAVTRDGEVEALTGESVEVATSPRYFRLQQS